MVKLLGNRWLRAAVLAGAGLMAPWAAPKALADDAYVLPDKPDPELGYRLLLTKPMAAAAMKVEDIDRLWQVWEPEEKAKAEAASAEERRKMTFTRYGWAQRPDDPNGLPLDYTEDGKGNLVSNCFTCHGGKVAGQTMLGGGNTHFDLTTIATDVLKLKQLDAGRDYSGVKDMILPYGAPLNWSRGNSNAVIFAPVLGSMRDKDMNISQMRNPGQLDNHDMNAPAWWNTGKKTQLYADGFAPHTVRQLMPFAMSPTISGEELRSFEPAFVHIKAYIDNLKPPKYPYAVNAELASKGKELFEQSCAGCHGTYGPDGKFPQKIIPLAKIKTDPIRLTAIKLERRIEANQGYFQYYGEHPVELESKGYMAPVLNGVWATAPYLHNGSVPTLADLFDSAKRPKVWKRDEDGYDQKNVGVVYEAFEAVPEGLNGRLSRQYYDTTSVSHSAAGHTFPEETLQGDDEKMAVIEYLKTL